MLTPVLLDFAAAAARPPAGPDRLARAPADAADSDSRGHWANLPVNLKSELPSGRRPQEGFLGLGTTHQPSKPEPVGDSTTLNAVAPMGLGRDRL
jgi:hypothetical protein